MAEQIALLAADTKELANHSSDQLCPALVCLCGGDGTGDVGAKRESLLPLCGFESVLCNGSGMAHPSPESFIT